VRVISGNPFMTDNELLRAYVARGSEDAFATIVGRYARLVYAAACRQTGNVQDAEDITQAVFVILARKAGSLRPNTILPGWLLRTTRFVALNARRHQWQRRRMECDAMIEDQAETDAAWERLSPLLDEALERLSAKDSDAVVLRYFERRNFKEIAKNMGTTEDGAQKRVTRAVAKLRACFIKRGLMLSSTHIATAITAHGVQAAPAHLPATVMAAVKSGAALTGSIAVLVKAGLGAWKAAQLKTIGLWAMPAVLMMPLACIFVTSKVRVNFMRNRSWQYLATSADGTKLVATVSGAGPIYVSKNSGASWHATGAPEGLWAGLASSADGTKLLAVGSDYEHVINPLIHSPTATTAWIYTSTNSGATWAPATGTPTNVHWTCAASSADGDKLVAAAGLGGIYISTNAGRTWNLSSAPNKQWHSLACSAEGNRLIALAATGGFFSQLPMAKGLLYTPDEPGLNAAGATNMLGSFVLGGIYTSADGGVTWTRTSATNDFGWWSIAASSDGRKLLAATADMPGNVRDFKQNPDGAAAFAFSTEFTGGGSIYVSTNAGIDWILTSAPTNRWVSVASSADATSLIAAGADVISISRDSGATWTTTKTPGANWTSVATSANANKIVAASKSDGVHVIIR
jgi:RNA polymerase sigma factor (sigma-70 family)